jgi:hypothetical protein
MDQKSGFNFNFDLNKVKAASEAIEQQAKERWGDNKDRREVYLDQVGKKDCPDQIFYRLVPFDTTPTDGLMYYEQIGWFVEYNRVVSALSINEPDEAHNMYLTAVEMAKDDEGIAAILHKDNYAKFQYGTQYFAPIILLEPVIEGGVMTGDFTIDPDPKKAIRMGVFRESLWTQVLTVLGNKFNNAGVTVYGPNARIWQSLKTTKGQQVRYETERIELTWDITEANPLMTQAHLDELLDWQTTGAWEYFKAGVTPAEVRMEWMNYVFQGGPRPASARPLKDSGKQQQPAPNNFGGGGLMGKLGKK